MFEISVESFLEMACSIAVLGGGSNKEYALHILHRVNGNIKVINLCYVFVRCSHGTDVTFILVQVLGSLMTVFIHTILVLYWS